MRLTKKVASFTLSEVMVVLVISAIVISLAVSVLNLVQQEMKSVVNNYENNDQKRMFEQVLTQDFNSRIIEFNNKGNSLFCVGQKDTVQYQLHTDYVLRNADTLVVKIAKRICYLDGVETETGIVDAVLLTLSREFNYQNIFVFKPKAATHYMNSNGI